MNYDFTAHIDRNGRSQSVVQHSANVSALSSDYAKCIGAASIAALAGMLHDAGKLSKEFDDYIQKRSDTKRGDIDHSFAGAKYICEFADKLDEVRYHNISRFIGRIIISHHGLHDWVDENCRDYFSYRISKDEAYDQIAENVGLAFKDEKLLDLLTKADQEYRTIRKELNESARQNGKLNETEFAFYLGLFERLMESILVDADRTDTADFMAGEKLSKTFDHPALWNDMQERLAETLTVFSKKSDVVSRQRMYISDRCAAFSDHKVGICHLIVPTGGGKTLSSLRFAIEYCIRHQKRKILYIAPFMSILEQNSDVIKKISGSEAFTEHHSDAISDIGSEEELHEYELSTERWDTPIIATTMVQFLNALFSGKMSCVRRMHALCDSVIIIDEIQSIPRKCVYLFNLAMNFLSRICGSSVILCSATQPPLEDMYHGLLVDEQSSMTGDWQEDFKVFARTKIIPSLSKYGMDYDEAAGFCVEKFNIAGNLLIIVNTKAAAQNIYERLVEKLGETVTVVYLSTNMCPEHRRDKIGFIRNCLQQQKSIVCVTTQLIEAGVDISFRCVVRSLAGLENAAQAAGRCNRHGKENEICNVYLIRLKDESLNGLSEIKDAQLASMQILSKYEENDTDLQSPEILTEFFRALYDMEKNTLSYNVKDNNKNTTIMDLLSLNSERYELSPKTESKLSAQAFKTAGSLFEVIDHNTTNVIVSYNDDADKIIEELDTERPDPFVLRKAQKYMIGIYSGTNRKLTDEHALRVLKSGVISLEKRYYNLDTGLQTENAMYETLVF